MTAENVQLRIDFITLSDAAKFADTFGGLVFATKRTPAQVDTVDAEEEPPEAA